MIRLARLARLVSQLGGPLGLTWCALGIWESETFKALRGWLRSHYARITK